MNDSEADQSRIIAGLEFLAGILTVILLVLVLIHFQPGNSPSQQLSDYPSNQSFYLAYAVVGLSWSVFSIPFVGGLYTMLRSKNTSLALSATLLSAGGIMLLGFALQSYVGALAAITAAPNLPSPTEATYQAAIWNNRHCQVFGC